jgi:hypothetical protein
MRVIIVGSVPANSPDLQVVKANLGQLVVALVTAGHEIFIRNPSRTDQSSIPVDEIVYAALKDAHQAQRIGLPEGTLTVIRELGAGDGFQIDLPHKTYSAGAAYRIDFYRQILDAIDMLIGIGGRDGLLRQAMICEYQRKPVFFLPGAGGAADLLWGEYFSKNYQVQYLTPEQLRQLRANPYINVHKSDYGQTTLQLIQLVQLQVSRRAKRDEIITLDGINLSEFGVAIGKFSMGLWLTLLGILASLISLAYWLGTMNFIGRHMGSLSK